MLTGGLLTVKLLTSVSYSAQDPRDRAILILIMDNGVRAGEVPVSDETRHLLIQIAATSPDDHVFHGHKSPMTKHLIYAIVHRHIEKAVWSQDSPQNSSID